MDVAHPEDLHVAAAECLGASKGIDPQEPPSLRLTASTSMTARPAEMSVDRHRGLVRCAFAHRALTHQTSDRRYELDGRQSSDHGACP
jgi:hypothetical protein